MQLASLHILLTYQCTFQCDHCFVFGSPWQSGTLTLAQIDDILQQAGKAHIPSIYFEGGEPFLYYAILLEAARRAHTLGFQVGVVSNAYWAVSLADARAALAPFAGLLADLSVSSDLYHYSEALSRQAQNAAAAAEQFGIPVGYISVCQPETAEAQASIGVVTGEGAAVMYRGRAAEKLSGRVHHHPWRSFTACPHEDLADPGRVHLDPLGNLHLCQGVLIGNLFEKPLAQICAEYDPAAHPVIAPLLAGGPRRLVEQFDLPYGEAYADACHLCFEARRLLRAEYPGLLAPEQVYVEAG